MFSTKDSYGNTKLISRSKAIVIDNRDPLQRGRIRVTHPQLGDTTWINYLRQPGEFSVPSINDVVYLECDVGTPTHPIASGVVTRGTDSSPELPSVFQRSVPTNRGMFTPGGHLFEMDDGIAPQIQTPTDTNYTTSNRGVRITSSGGNKIHIIEDLESLNTYILLRDANNNYIKIDYTNNTNTITVEATNIKLGQNATESVIKGDVFKTYFDSHVHTGNLGAPTTPPTVPMPLSTLSTKTKTE